jgi:esterase
MMHGELSFAEVGVGSPVVILHGLFGSKRNWAGIARRLGHQHRVLAVDLRNHGDSPWDPCHDYPALAGDVAALIRSHVGGPVAVIGHSMGGKAGMTLALTRPELVSRLVVVDIAPAVSAGTTAGVLAALQAVPLKSLTRRSDVEAFLADRLADPAVRAFLVQNVIATADGLAWRVNLDALAKNITTVLGFPTLSQTACFRGPTLFLAGGRSDYVRREHHVEIERLFPAVQIEVIPDAGHWVQADAPELFLDLVGNFLTA